MEIITHVLAPMLVGFAIGIFSGLLGIGGGTIMVPVFRLAFDMSALMATATSLFAIIPTSISGAITHVRGKTCIVALGVAAGIGGACTSPIGVWLATVSPSWMVILAASLIIGYSAISMLVKAFKMKPASTAVAGGAVAGAAENPGGAQGLGGAGEPDVAGAAGTVGAAGDAGSRSAPENLAPEGSGKMGRRQLLIGAAIGLGAGLASGYVGVGGGFIMVPLMLSLLGIPMKMASGTSLIAVTILAIPGVVEQAVLGNIVYSAGIAVAIGSIPGAIVGARLVVRAPERALRFTFGGFLIAAAALLLINEIGLLG